MIRRAALLLATVLARDGRPVLFVGLDGADWELLDAYLLADVFNILNAQKAVLVDQRWGFQEADNDEEISVNPGYKRPVLRTPPASFRLGVRVSF